MSGHRPPRVSWDAVAAGIAYLERWHDAYDVAIHNECEPDEAARSADQMTGLSRLYTQPRPDTRGLHQQFAETWEHSA